MIATLTKLLVINIVAKRPRGFFSKAKVVSACLSDLSAIASLSLGVKEKKATSAPETKAEQAKSINTMRIDKAKGQI